ncbi:MAG: hypothetical protein Q7R32_05650 [Dehalococcoidia bacterium]|nr:hypothetical protein [Dehalococcoidia bacterium]
MTRRRARRRQQYQYRIPDWVWGLGLGLIIVIFAGGYFLFGAVTGGGGGGGCGKALPPLPGGAQADAAGFREEDVALGLVIDYLSQGDLDNSFASFYGDTHAFTHNIDPDIRPVDEEMAKALCEAVIQVETDFDPPPPTERSLPKMKSSTETLRNQLRGVAEALGFPRPGQ